MRRGGKRGTRGAWVAAIVVVALIGALAASQFGAGTGGSPGGTSTVTGTVVGTTTSTATTSGAGGSGAATATATVTATATSGAGTETGGPLGAVRQYFAALAAANYPAAYALLAPSYRSAHTLASFVTGLPAKAPALGSATVTSVANFHATVQISMTPAGGTAKTESVQLVNANSAATSSATTQWLLEAPPAGAGG